MSQPPAPPAPDDRDRRGNSGEPASKPETSASGQPSGLTKLGKIGDSEPKIDTVKRARIDQLWQFAFRENAQPTATLSQQPTVPLQPGDRTRASAVGDDWQERLPHSSIDGSAGAPRNTPAAPRGGVIVEDPTGQVLVHDSAADSADGANDGLNDDLAGGTLDALPGQTMDAAPGRTIDAPTDAPLQDATGHVADGAHSPNAPTLIGSHPVTRGGTGMTARGSGAGSSAGTNKPISSTAPTLPGSADGSSPVWSGRQGLAAPLGGKPLPASRVMSPRPEDFRIEAKLASGGMGDVYLATQLGLQRVVALKRPKANLQSSDHRLSAFVREGTVTGDLEHPSIVPIYQNGVDADGLPYYAMKRVLGIEWRYLLHPDAAKERKDPAFINLVAQKGAAMDLHEHLAVLLKVCDAVAFAHSRYILHRDLKPENVIVGDFGEVQVMDWGLAIDYRDTTPTASKALSRTNIKGPSGTPAYMSPEMALGEVAKIGPATDVYLLGAILYEILTSRPPHNGAKLDRVLYQAAVNEYVPVNQANLDISPGLTAIVQQALATEPQDRFPSVQAFQQAIREHLTHEQSLKISAKAAAELDQLLQVVPPVAGIGGAAAGSDPDKDGITTSARYVKFAELVASFRQALDLWPLNEQAHRGLHRGLVAFIEAALAGGDLGLARAQLEQLKIVAAHADTAARADVARLTTRWQTLDQARRARQRNFKLAIASVAVLLILLVVGGAFSYINIRLERDRAETERIKADEQRTIAETQQHIAETEKAKAEKLRSEAVHAQMDANQQREVAEKNAELARKSEAAAIQEKTEADRQRTIADDQRKQAETQKTEAEKQRGIADTQRQVAEAKTKEAEVARTAAEHSRAVAVSERAQAIKNLGAVDIQRARTVIAANRDYPQAAAFFLRAVQNMAETDPSQPLRELDAVFQASPRLTGHYGYAVLAGGIRQVAFDPADPKTLIVLEGADTVARGPIGTGGDDNDLLQKPDDAGNPPPPVARGFAHFLGHWIILDATGSLRRRPEPPAGLQDLSQRMDAAPALNVTGLEKTRFTTLAADPDTTTRRLALGATDGRLIVLQGLADSASILEEDDEPAELPTLKILCDIPAHHGAVTGLAFRAKTNELITTGADGKICVWDLTTKKQVRARQAHLGFSSALAVDPTGATAATAGADGAIKIWNLADLSERLTLQGHLREVGALAFHPSKPILASQSYDNTVRLWNTGAEALDTAALATLHVENKSSAAEVLFSPDGKTLACLTSGGAGGGGNLQLWDLQDRVDDTPPAWRDLRLNQARLLYTLNDGIVLHGDGGLLTLTPADNAPRSEPVPNLATAFRPVSDPDHPICLTTTGQFGPANKLAPLPAALANAGAGKLSGWAVQSPFVLINQGGAFQFADTTQPGWRFAGIHSDAASVGLALATDGRFFSWSADNQMAFSTVPAQPGHEGDFSVNHILQAYPQKILQAAWLPHGAGVILRTGQADLPIVTPDGESVGALTGHLAPVRVIALDTTGRFLASADASGQLRLTDLTDRASAPFGPPLPAPADDLLFDPAGVFLFCHLENGQLIRYRLPQSDPQFDLFELRDRVQDDLGIDPNTFAPATPHETDAPARAPHAPRARPAAHPPAAGPAGAHP